MTIPYRVHVPENRYNNPMRIFADIDLDLPSDCVFTIRFYSSSRDNTAYEIFDESGASMGRRTFNCSSGPVLVPLTLDLIEDLNVLLEEYKKEVTFEDFTPITQEAICFCEGKYGLYQIDDGDGIITFS